ncbi:fibropellin-3-like [Pollicipes pollicipes]|uniref:fibropellin-3-like n=1 Tax=Pollicipes pollicipes TaxID=41117 RepID=UPI001885586A|nr:fibropellin-3-like [Pollicipes pollicipes]
MARDLGRSPGDHLLGLHYHKNLPPANCSLQHLCPAQTCRHGICLDDGHGGECFCEDGFTGLYCEADADDCLSSPCRHGGTCSDLVRGFSCACNPGYAGERCELTVAGCEQARCENGASCVRALHGTACLCPPGFSGLRCETDVSVCRLVSPPHVRCHNGGLCRDGLANTYRCQCQPGFAGATCLTDVDECASSPCQKRWHLLRPDKWLPMFLLGFSGHRCQTALRSCEQNVCDNGALCVRTGGGPACLCRPDFHGDRCQFQYDDCLPKPRSASAAEEG